jgi:hypothetical protein
MLVSHRYKFIYLKAVKVAGTSTEVFFQRYCLSPEEELTYKHEHGTDETVSEHGIIGYRLFRKNPKHMKGGKWYNHKPAAEIKKDLGANIFDSYEKICNIRNPYDIAVSYYHFNGSQIGEDRPVSKALFEKWLNKQNIRNVLDSNKRIWAINGSYNFNYIKQENLKEDIIRVCKKLNISTDNIEIPEYKISEGRTHYREYYTENTKKIIESIYSKELKLFDYSF